MVRAMSGYRTLSFATTRAITNAESGGEWLPLRNDLDVQAFGVNGWRADAGREVIERHDEATGHQEVYVVVSGSARFEIGGDAVPAPAGTVVFVEDPALERRAVAEEDGTFVLAIGAEAGRAFTVSGWEQQALAGA
jgi:hypothetical protein